YNGTNDASGIYQEGITTVVWTVTDVHGNVSICTQIITVNDEEVPVFTCPDAITVNNDEGECSTLITMDTVTATDNCGVEAIINDYNGTDNATDIYPVGTTVVTWTVTDIHGNISTCTQTIEVID